MPDPTPEAVVTPPAAPTELTFQFPDGSVVKGATQEELLQKAAQRYTDSRAEAEKIKTEKRALEQSIQQVVTPTPQATGGFDQSKFWEMMNAEPQKAILYALSGEFQTDPDTFKSTLLGAVEGVSDYQSSKLASTFMAKHPDFPSDNPKAGEILAANTESLSLDSMEKAHAYCLQNKLYEAVPVTAPTSEAQVPLAPPMLNQGAASQVGTQDAGAQAEAMPAAQLRELIEKLAAGGQ